MGSHVPSPCPSKGAEPPAVSGSPPQSRILGFSLVPSSFQLCIPPGAIQKGLGFGFSQENPSDPLPLHQKVESFGTRPQKALGQFGSVPTTPVTMGKTVPTTLPRDLPFSLPSYPRLQPPHLTRQATSRAARSNFRQQEKHFAWRKWNNRDFVGRKHPHTPSKGGVRGHGAA